MTKKGLVPDATTEVPRNCAKKWLNDNFNSDLNQNRLNFDFFSEIDFSIESAANLPDVTWNSTCFTFAFSICRV